ncbi:MAG TPA: hypothetical protein VFB02_11185 [Bradyrhizobium sp.]|nr:hypothetical protein [Bradyrhizobium sp.]
MELDAPLSETGQNGKTDRSINLNPKQAAGCVKSDLPDRQDPLALAFRTARPESQFTCAEDEICPAESSMLMGSRSARKNISLANFRKSVFLCVIPPRSSEGRIAIVTTREAGMRWTLTCLLTSGADADGEIAWSWRPKGWRSSPSEAEELREGRRWQSARFTEESAL